MQVKPTGKIRSYRASVFASAYKIDVANAKKFKSGRTIAVKDDVGEELIAAGLATRCVIPEVKKKQDEKTPYPKAFKSVADKGDNK